MIKIVMRIWGIIFTIFNVSTATACPLLDPDQARQIIIQNQFERERGYLRYARAFGKAYQAKMLSLGPTDHYLDLGAGQALSAQQVAGRILPDPSENQKMLDEEQRALMNDPFVKRMFNNPVALPNVTAISYVRGPISLHPESRLNFQYLTDRFFEDIPNDEITSTFGLVKAGADFFGVTAYTDRLGEAIQKIHEISHEDAEIFIYLGETTPEFNAQVIAEAEKGNLIGRIFPGGASTSTLYNTVILVNGKPVQLPYYLASLPQFRSELHGDFMILRPEKIKEAFSKLKFIKSRKVGSKPYPRLFEQLE